MIQAVDRILEETADLRSDLLQHRVYGSIRSVPDLRLFMSHHVFAVLDFMWLLKRLQQDVCCTAIPWIPAPDPGLARFVNEIVLAEETDEDGHGGHCSHFELYLGAMQDIGASVKPVCNFVESLRGKTSVEEALHAVPIPTSVRSFVSFTHALAATSTTAQVAAAFCFGREDVIPEMFQRFLSGLTEHGLPAPRLRYYIQRHIELDGDHHGPLTRRLVNKLCGTGPQTLEQSVMAARQAISHRIALWDGVVSEMTTNSD
jgi:hypothetical protein